MFVAGFVAAVRAAAALALAERSGELLALSYDVPGSDTPEPTPALRTSDMPWDDDPAFLLNPAEWGSPELVVELDDDTKAARQQLELWLRHHDDPQLPRRVALAAANELRQVEWTQVGSVSEDFLVYAVDVEIENLERDLPTPRSPRQEQAWRELGVT